MRYYRAVAAAALGRGDAVDFLAMKEPEAHGALSAGELDGLEELQTQDPGAFANANKQLLEAHDIPIVGACCGSNPEHIREIAGFLKNQ